MAPEAVKKNVLKAIEEMGGDATFAEIYEVVGWWTKATVRDGVDALLSEGKIKLHGLGYSIPPNRFAESIAER